MNDRSFVPTPSDFEQEFVFELRGPRLRRAFARPARRPLRRRPRPRPIRRPRFPVRGPRPPWWTGATLDLTFDEPAPAAEPAEPEPEPGTSAPDAAEPEPEPAAAAEPDASEWESEWELSAPGTSTAQPEPKKTEVPFAPLPPSGSYWPVKTSHPQARLVSYRTTAGKIVGRAGRVFKAGRKGKRNGVVTARNHAGIDLFAYRGDAVIACENGTVVDFSFFYNAKSGQRTYKILVEHSGVVVNYGEVSPDSFKRTGLKAGSPVRAGQVIGYVSDTSMLHFETYTRGSKSAYRWWTGDSPPPRLLDPTRYLLHLARYGAGAPGASTPATAPAAPPSRRAQPKTAASTDRDVAEARVIAKREVPGMPGTTTEALIEQWRQRICPEVPRSILLAFVKYESGGKFTDATHGTKKNGWTSPTFYELGIFQVPGGLHGRCTSGDWRSCEFAPPGREGRSPSTWARLCAKIGADPQQWTNPTTQVRVGLADLEEGARGLRKDFPELFPAPGSDWDIRMAVLYRFSRGSGYARSFLKKFRSQLAGMPEAQRWAFLRDKSVDVTVTKGGRRVTVTRTLKGENVEKKMALASKLGYTPNAALRPSSVQGEVPSVKGAAKGAQSPLVGEEQTPAALTKIVKVPLRAASTPDWRQWSAVYFPPAVSRNSRTIDVILYLHGHRTAIPGSRKSVWAYLKHKCWPLREHLAASGKAAVLIAPTLGPKSQAGKLLERGGLDQYLDAVLAATASYWSSGAAPAIRNVILAGHSGAGVPMRLLARSGNRYAALIKEVWGFDSTYAAINNVDSEGWAAWAKAHPQSRLFIYYLRGAPTQNQAEKLGKRALPNVSVIASNAKTREGIHPHFWVPIQHWGERIAASPYLRR